MLNKMADSILLNNESNKTSDFKNNELLNNIILELSLLLKPIQLEIQKKFDNTKWPIGLIVGNPRSGTTLFLQWIAHLGYFSYPTNVLNRFAYAPYIGAQIQKILFDSDYDFNGEFSDLNSEINFKSNLGKSKGALASNEFQHFFRNYMLNFDPEYLSGELLKNVDFDGIRNGISSLEFVFGKPFITKGMMLQYNISELYRNIPNSIFFFMKRDPIINIQSIFLARKKYYNDTNIWWSVKPKEYSILKNKDVYHQIAGQVYYTNSSIEKELNKLPKNNFIKIKYEDFCRAPKKVYNELVAKYAVNGYQINENYKGIERFKVNDEIILTKKEIRKFEIAYSDFENGN